MLSNTEKELRFLKRFSQVKIPGENLLQFLENNNFGPTEVKDYGEIPDFYKYLDEFKTSIYIDVDPWFNDHHKDNHPRSITSISFGKRNAPFISSRIKLRDVDTDLLRELINKVTHLINKHSCL